VSGTIRAMPRYEYRCRTCDERFELQRTMSESDAPATCPDGHADTVRLLSMFATTGTTLTRAGVAAIGGGGGGGCCGGSCGCTH
jgi:putative FmdB family regulatory protein